MNKLCTAHLGISKARPEHRAIQSLGISYWEGEAASSSAFPGVLWSNIDVSLLHPCSIYWAALFVIVGAFATILWSRNSDLVVEEWKLKQEFNWKIPQNVIWTQMYLIPQSEAFNTLRNYRSYDGLLDWCDSYIIHWLLLSLLWVWGGRGMHWLVMRQALGKYLIKEVCVGMVSFIFPDYWWTLMVSFYLTFHTVIVQVLMCHSLVLWPLLKRPLHSSEPWFPCQQNGGRNVSSAYPFWWPNKMRSIQVPVWESCSCGKLPN